MTADQKEELKNYIRDHGRPPMPYTSGDIPMTLPESFIFTLNDVALIERELATERLENITEFTSGIVDHAMDALQYMLFREIHSELSVRELWNQSHQQQPVIEEERDSRTFLSDPNLMFGCDFGSVPTPTQYKNCSECPAIKLEIFFTCKDNRRGHKGQVLCPKCFEVKKSKHTAKEVI